MEYTQHAKVLPPPLVNRAFGTLVAPMCGRYTLLRHGGGGGYFLAVPLHHGDFCLGGGGGFYKGAPRVRHSATGYLPHYWFGVSFALCTWLQLERA